jgi:hypothetical protein
MKETIKILTKVWDYTSGETDHLAELVQKDKGIVMTKDSMAKDLIDMVDFIDGETVIEPCRGNGAFYNNLPDNVNKIWCEINEDRDYLTFDGEADVCLSNPPFVPRKLFWEFTIKAMETTKRKIYWLISMHSINVFTPVRMEIMEDKGWFIQHFHIVSDKRWYGRYVWIEIGREDTGFFTWKKATY